MTNTHRPLAHFTGTLSLALSAFPRTLISPASPGSLRSLSPQVAQTAIGCIAAATASSTGTTHDRYHPCPHRPRDPHLPAAQARRGQDQTRGHTLPKAPPRQTSPSSPLDATNHLTTQDTDTAELCNFRALLDIGATSRGCLRGLVLTRRYHALRRAGSKGGSCPSRSLLRHCLLRRLPAWIAWPVPTSIRKLSGSKKNNAQSARPPPWCRRIPQMLDAHVLVAVLSAVRLAQPEVLAAEAQIYHLLAAAVRRVPERPRGAQRSENGHVERQGSAEISDRQINVVDARDRHSVASYSCSTFPSDIACPHSSVGVVRDAHEQSLLPHGRSASDDARIDQREEFAFTRSSTTCPCASPEVGGVTKAWKPGHRRTSGLVERTGMARAMLTSV
jgi:hypothetical protein